MTAKEIVAQLEPLGADGYKKILLNHGAVEPVLGVKIEELKKYQKSIKKDYQLALDLYDTGIYDAMYLAGLIADDMKMSRKDLQHWAKTATCPGIAEYTVAWVASESRFGHELALEWIESKKESVAATGWATLSALVSLTPDAELDLDELRKLLARAAKTIHQQPNRVRYAMNGFVIATGCYVRELTDESIKTAAAIGEVYVDMSGTSCKVPSAAEQIHKVEKRGAIGKKRKTAKC